MFNKGNGAKMVSTYKEKAMFRFLKLKPESKQTYTDWFPRRQDVAKNYGASFCHSDVGLIIKH
jgi:hypothetical protein